MANFGTGYGYGILVIEMGGNRREATEKKNSFRSDHRRTSTRLLAVLQGLLGILFCNTRCVEGGGLVALMIWCGGMD